MSATTIKLEGSILKELKEAKRADQTLSALIRELLEAELRRRKMSLAAHEYASFVRENLSESQEMDAWSSAPLHQDVDLRKKKK